jgi:homogentisate 1,2-dioxygenase
MTRPPDPEPRDKPQTHIMPVMLETRVPQHLTRFVAFKELLQNDQIDCRAGMKKKCDASQVGGGVQ